VDQETTGHGAMDHAAAGHEGGGSFPPFDQLDTFPSQIFWLAVTFGILYFVLSTYLLPKIQKAISDREGAIARDVEEAGALSRKADDAVKAFEQRIAEARVRARETADKARAEADSRIAAETARVEADLAKRLGEAERKVADLRTAAMSNVAGVAEDAAAAIVEKLSGVRPDAGAVKRAVDAIGARG
jgi:F-type H+-transporting ATPase subunit b